MNISETVSRMLIALKAAFSSASADDVIAASKDLIRNSDLVKCSEPGAYSDDDITSISEGVLSFISSPDSCCTICLQPNKNRAYAEIDALEFAKVHSSDLFYQNIQMGVYLCGTNKPIPSSVAQFLVAVFLRYVYCVYTDEMTFPLSDLMEYVDSACPGELTAEHCEDKQKILFWTVMALQMHDPNFNYRQEMKRIRCTI